MDKVAEVVSLIKNTSSMNDKQYILKRNENLPGLKEVMKFIYDPYLRTGISKHKLNKAMERRLMVRNSDIDFREAISYFTLHNTGSDADIAVAAQFIEYTTRTYEDKRIVDLAKSIVTQELKIGVTAKTLNNVFGADFIPIIGCMLGTPLGDVNPASIAWPAIVTKKHDGVRRLAIKESGVTKMYSRSGHLDPYLVEIVPEMSHLPDNTVYDGELLAIGTFKDCIAQRQATNSIANKKGPKTGLTFNVFDMVPLEQFRKGKSKDGALLRKTLLAATLMDQSAALLDNNYARLIAAFGIHKELKFIKHTPILGVVHSVEQVTPIVEAIWANGEEGVMLNTVSGLYEIKRSKQLLKVKHTEEMTLKIIGFKEGNDDFEGMLGSFIVDYKGNCVGVGSGLDIHLRRKVWNNQDAYIGRMIEVDTFGESTNAQGSVSINCPIFKRFAGEVE